MRKITDADLETLRRSRIGFAVKIGGMIIVPLRFHFVNKRCGNCLFRKEDSGAEICPYSPACMAHLRKDHESVFFKKSINSLKQFKAIQE